MSLGLSCLAYSTPGSVARCSLVGPVVSSSLAESETLRHVTEITFDHESDSPRELVGEVNLVEPILSDAYL